MENFKARELGYKRATEDIKEMGIDWTKNMFALRLKCTGVDPWFTTGYGEALVYQEEARKQANA